MAKAKRRKSPNADLVKAVQDRTEDILDFYEEVRGRTARHCARLSEADNRCLSL